ncbi:MAG TPA: endonuclease V [Sphingomonas sp.]|nr:endonuclease V [Sphingomonas sp.]
MIDTTQEMADWAATRRVPIDWIAPPSLTDATRAQRAIAEVCETADRIGPVARIAGADTSSKWRDRSGPIHAAIAPLDWPEREALPPSAATRIPPFPYVSGYLGFREAPSLVAAWEALETKPDLLFVDGHGRAHPRRSGIATHLGVLLDTPTIGIAKTILCGRIEGDLADRPGATAPLVDRGEMVALAVRTRPRCRPIYVSIGHRVSLETAVEWALALSEGRRQPLPIRLAHDAANAARRAWTELQA